MAVRQWWIARDTRNLRKDTDQMPRKLSRDDLGRKVREVWITWAWQTVNPKPSWFVEYDDLTDQDQEADRMIGEELFNKGMDAGADFIFDTLARALGLENWSPQDGSETWEGDVSATLYRLLYDAKVLDDNTNKRPDFATSDRKHGYTVNLTEQEMDALEALAKEHDLPPWRVLLQGLRLYQMNAHPVDLGPKLATEETLTEWANPEAIDKRLESYSTVGGVKIKPLIWHETTPADSDGWCEWTAVTLLGQYDVYAYDGSDSPYWVTVHNDRLIADKESPDEAKQAAQEDFQRRVLKMLDL